MTWFRSSQPYVLIVGALLLITLGTLAYAQGGCELEVTHEERVECYLSDLSSQAHLGSAAAVVADLAPVALLVGTVAVALGLARVGGAAVR